MTGRHGTEGTHVVTTCPRGRTRFVSFGALIALLVAPLVVATPATAAPPIAGFTSVSAGGAHTCAVTTAGGIKCWGLNSSGELGNNSYLSFPCRGRSSGRGNSRTWWR